MSKTEVEVGNIFRVTGEHDKNEGRGGRYIVDYSFDENKAKELSKGHGVMGYCGAIEKIDVVIFSDGSIYQLGAKLTNVHNLDLFK